VSRRWAALAAVAGALVLAAPAATEPGLTVVAKGLNNPRGLELAPDGSLFVAQAGVGGPRCEGQGEDEQCLGLTGAIDRIARGKRERYAAGFLSGAGKGGAFAAGVDDVAIAPSGAVYGIVGGSAADLPARMAAQAGKLLRVERGRKIAVADVAAYELAHNPDASDVNPNAYAVAWSPVGLAVADAGGNSLLRVGADGRVTTLATFPAHRLGGRAAQSVPTTVVWHEGAFYVGELAMGAPDGRARVWRVAPGGRPSVYRAGFTTITGIAFGPDGSLYVSELLRDGPAQFERGDFTGAVVRVGPDGRRSELARGRLAAPAGVAVAGDGTVYVAVNSLFPGRGQIVALRAS
jgi:sugar lactone lactonase YvrE